MQFKTTKLLKRACLLTMQQMAVTRAVAILNAKKKGVEQHPHSLSDGRKAENIRGYFLTPYGFH